MKTTSRLSHSASFTLCLCVATVVFAASRLNGQDTAESQAVPLPDTTAFASETNSLWFVAGDTNAMQESVAALQARVAGAVLPAVPDGMIQDTNRFLESFEEGTVEASLLLTESPMPMSQFAVEPQPGGWLESLIVNNRVLNVDFGDMFNTKTGLAAIGQSASDYWNPYVKPGSYLWTVANLLWSDRSESLVDLTVANAPGQWGSLLCVDPMYAYYIYRYPWAGNITVTLNELPPDTYDFYVYAARASDNGAPVIELKRDGVSIQTKGTTLWGNGWYSTYWDEHEQYVRFRNVAVNNQTISFEMYPDGVGYPSISGLQIVPSSAIPADEPAILGLLNVDFGGTGSEYKRGLAAVGLEVNDFWNGGGTAASKTILSNLKWSDESACSATITIANGSGRASNALPDPMFRTYMYATGGRSTTITITGLPAGVCDVYLYGHTATADDNAVFELWSDEVNWGTKGTSLFGPGPTYATWEIGQQYVRFKNATVADGKPVVIHAKHTKYGYNNVSGMQVAYTGALDTDADGLTDGWEQRSFGNLDQLAAADADADGLNNLREYQLGTEPTRTDSNGNGLSDLNDFESVWFDDLTPQGAYEGGFSEGWNWVSAWYDGVGWGGQTLYPHSGRSWDPRMHVSANVPNAAHQHYFESSLPSIRPAVGDVLYAYVNLDPTYPPTEVMLQWYVITDSGSGGVAAWDHRAYWGANSINWGVNGTASRYYMGPLPAAGGWVRLEVPASVVGVEGKVIEGMAFALYGGRAAFDSTGTMKPDHDGDTLPDAWEIQYFGNLLQIATGDPDEDWFTNSDEYQHGTDPTNPDTDDDGLYDSEELQILLDASNPGLGYLDPLNRDTGSTGMTDDMKDGDHDGISNWGELRNYFSDPSNAHTFNPFKDDAQYFHSARNGQSGITMAHLSNPVGAGGEFITLTISGAFPNAEYDLYFVPEITGWKWRRVYSGIHCDNAGYAAFPLPNPNWAQGFFVALSAEDDDSDGLSNGYESWFQYSGRRTIVDDQDSERPLADDLLDGWEVAYGLDPTDATGENGKDGDPDDDSLSNEGEHTGSATFTQPSFDPLKFYGSTASGEQARPVVSISSADPDADLLGGTATFTIRRKIGAGANLNNVLRVYYSVGGTARYGTDYGLKYGLNQLPPEYPRIFSADIPAGEETVTVTLEPLLAASLKQAGIQTVTIKLTPFGVSTVPQKLEPTDWEYVVDLFHEAFTLRIFNGILINLEKTPDGYLRIKPTSETSPLPFINVANSVRGTVARIYTGANASTDPSKVVGEYWTMPGGQGDPSRTTVDRYGNVWVGNRNIGGDEPGSITQLGVVIGGRRGKKIEGVFVPDPDPLPPTEAPGEYLQPPFIYNTCVDRVGGGPNGDQPDGLIRTSQHGAPDLTLPWPFNLPDSLGGVSQAEDEAILRYLRVAPTHVRTIIVDPNNNVWVGSRDNWWHELVDTSAGMQVTGWRVNFQGGGYGGVIDGYGAVWSSGYLQQGGDPNAFRLVRFQPEPAMPVTAGGTIRRTGHNYGITVDPNSGDVWQALYDSANVMHFRADHCTTTFQIGQFPNKGIIVDGRGNVWVGTDSGDEIFHLTTSGVSVGSVPLTLTPPGQPTGSSPIGVTVDAFGMVWAICQSGTSGHGYAMRIDPLQNPESNPDHAPPIGKVVEVIDLGAASGPYNYSDMSGFVALSATQPSGVWDYVEDSGVADTLWASLTMDAVVPTGTKVVVEVRGANEITELPSWPFVTVVNGTETPPPTSVQLPSGIKGRYLEVRANLLRNFGVPEGPELRSLAVQHAEDPGCDIQITAHPKSLAVALEANNVRFNVTAEVPGGATATYQWYKDGVMINNETSAELIINNANYSHAGRYTVKVGASGCGAFQLESAPARLHVEGDPPEITQDLPATQSVAQGGEVTLTVGVSAGLNPGPGETPISYQWRRNNEPLTGPGTSGECASGNCNNIQYSVAGLCENAAIYSVVFWNRYGQKSTVNCELSIAGENQVALTASSTVVNADDDVVDLTAETCLHLPINCVQWYLKSSDGRKTAIPHSPHPSDPTNLLKYRIPTPITCDQIGEYTVSVADAGWNSYEASIAVWAGNPGIGAGIASTTLEITPDNVGNGMWTFQWSRSDSTDGVIYNDIQDATSQSLQLSQSGYYKVTAKRPGATAIVKVMYDSTIPDVQVGISENAALDIKYAAAEHQLAWTYQWYFTPENSSVEEKIQGATASQYTIRSVDCTHKGSYRVEVNCDSVSSATASVRVNAFGLSSSTLEIVPVGQGNWVYTWYSSATDGNYQPVLPNPGTPYYTLPAGETPFPGKYYKVEATRTEGTASAIVQYYSDPSLGTAARVKQTISANLKVTFAAGSVGSGGTYEWFFTPFGGSATGTGVTSPAYTINPADCSKRGTYSVKISDTCGRSANPDARATLQVDGCQ